MISYIKHLAIIMDGNNRWAKKNRLSIVEGYKKGLETLKKLLPLLPSLQIPYFTFYTFSSENWKRPKKEIDCLMKLFKSNFRLISKLCLENNLKARVIGRTEKYDDAMLEQIKYLEDVTVNNTGPTISFAASYGGKLEILDACNAIIKAKESVVDESIFKSYLYDSEMPDVDLLIRTSGVQRVSNFLLWHISYAEFIFLEKLWPEITIDDIYDSIKQYNKNIRNFGTRKYG